MAVFGPHLLPIQLVQIGLDVLAAVPDRRPSAGGWPDRAAPGRGWPTPLNFHAIEQCTTTLTENLSTRRSCWPRSRC